MNTETFFQQFELLADAPNGIAKLRELILQLAVQGKLVPQNSDDEPAAVLLEKIKAEKERLVKERKIKKPKKLPDIKQDEIPFELPDSWQWERLENICSYIQRGKSPKYVEKSDICVISQKCVQWDGFDIEKARFIDPSTLNKYGEERFLIENDILWNSTGRGTIGRVCICKIFNNLPYTKVVADSHVTIIRCLYLKCEFVLDWLSSDYVQSKIDDISSGTTKQTELNTSTVKNHLVPLPPLAEQKRIVEKVDRLMELCDKLETQQKQQQTKTLQLGTVATSRLTASKTPRAFKQHWQNISNNFDLIYSTPENIKQLRQKNGSVSR